MIRDITTVMRGTLIAQGIGLLALPVVSRLFAPSAFGHFGFYQAVLLVVTAFICLRYEQAILTAEAERDAIGLLQLCIVAALGVSIVAGLLLAILYVAGVEVIRTAPLPLSLFAPAFLLSGSVLAANAYLTRVGAFEASARLKIVQSAANTVASIGVGTFSGTGAGLVVADMVGKVAAVPVAVGKIGADGNRLWRPDPTRLWVLARQFSDFPRYSIVGGLLNNGGSFLAPSMLYLFFGAATAGQFALLDRAINLPLALIVLATSQVFTSHLGRILRENRADAIPYYLSVVRNCALIGLAPALVGAALAPSLFVWLFGAEWAEAGRFAQLMAPYYYSAFIMGAVNGALVVAGRLRWQLFWEAARFALYAALWAGALKLSFAAPVAIGAFSVVGFLVNIWFCLLAYQQLKNVCVEEAAPEPGEEPA